MLVQGWAFGIRWGLGLCHSFKQLEGWGIESSAFDLRGINKQVRNLLPGWGMATKLPFHPPCPVNHQIILILLSSCFSDRLHVFEFSFLLLWSWLPSSLKRPRGLFPLPLTSVLCLNELFLKFRSDHNILLSSVLQVSRLPTDQGLNPTAGHTRLFPVVLTRWVSSSSLCAFAYVSWACTPFPWPAFKSQLGCLFLPWLLQADTDMPSSLPLSYCPVLPLKVIFITAFIFIIIKCLFIQLPFLLD